MHSASDFRSDTRYPLTFTSMGNPNGAARTTSTLEPGVKPISSNRNVSDPFTPLIMAELFFFTSESVFIDF